MSKRFFLTPRTVGPDHSDLVADVLKELSNHNERSEERKGALVELLKITREDNTAVWDEHFKTILLLLLETLCDKDVRALLLQTSSLILDFQNKSPEFVLILFVFVFLNPAHNPSSGSARTERNTEEPAGPIQKLRGADYHEDPGGSQRLSQGGNRDQDQDRSV